MQEIEGDWNLDCALDNPVARVTKGEIGMGVTRGESKVPGALLRGCGGRGRVSDLERLWILLTFYPSD